MKKKKWMRIGIALALSVSMTAGTAAVPAVAEASTGSIIGAIIGGAFGGSFFLFCLWLNAKDAQRRYPELRIPVPANAQNDPLFHIWCDASHYQQQPDGSYQSTRRGILANTGEIRFEHNEMLVYEVIDIGFARRRFALNAPVVLARAIRQRKVRQLNKLLKHWQIAPLDDTF